jgi:hypothetical protein
MGVKFYKQEEGHEFYGPWDGVLPVDYPQVYEELLTYYCIQLCRPAYRTRDHVICHTCFYNLYPEEQDLYENSARHYICDHSSRMRAAFCRNCGIRVATISPAGDCSDCIEEYFTLSASDRNLLAQGRLIRVNRYWGH